MRRRSAAREAPMPVPADPAWLSQTATRRPSRRRAHRPAAMPCCCRHGRAPRAWLRRDWPVLPRADLAGRWQRCRSIAPAIPWSASGSSRSASGAASHGEDPLPQADRRRTNERARGGGSAVARSDRSWLGPTPDQEGVQHRRSRPGDSRGGGWGEAAVKRRQSGEHRALVLSQRAPGGGQHGTDASMAYGQARIGRAQDVEAGRQLVQQVRAATASGSGSPRARRPAAGRRAGRRSRRSDRGWRP